MPRTGTTLVERILGSHADVVSLGELVDFPAEMTDTGASARTPRAGSTDPDLLRASLEMDFAELGRNYLKAVRPLAGGRKYFIDKLPFNFRYCGLIHQALPNAKIVHLTRDPLDTCYAVFKTLFINAYHYSYQLDELAQFYVAYRRTMDALACRDAGRHLRRELRGPGRRSARAVPQVAGVVRPAVAGRRAGFPPVATLASTTASAAQVRKPIYTSSVQKWRNFAQQLQPVVRRLAAAGLVDAEGNALPSPGPG